MQAHADWLSRARSILVILTALLAPTQCVNPNQNTNQQKLPQCDLLLSGLASFRHVKAPPPERHTVSVYDEKLFYLNSSALLTGFPQQFSICPRHNAAVLVTSNTFYCCGGFNRDEAMKYVWVPDNNCQVTTIDDVKFKKTFEDPIGPVYKYDVPESFTNGDEVDIYIKGFKYDTHRNLQFLTNQFQEGLDQFVVLVNNSDHAFFMGKNYYNKTTITSGGEAPRQQNSIRQFCVNANQYTICTRNNTYYEIWDLRDKQSISYSLHRFDDKTYRPSAFTVYGIQICDDKLRLYGIPQKGDIKNFTSIQHPLPSNIQISPICSNQCQIFAAMAGEHLVKCIDNKCTSIPNIYKGKQYHYIMYPSPIIGSSEFTIPQCLPANKTIDFKEQFSNCHWEIPVLPMQKWFSPMNYLLAGISITTLVMLYFATIRFRRRDKYGFLRFTNFDKFYLIDKPISGGSADVYQAWYTTGYLPKVENVEILKVALKQYKQCKTPTSYQDTARVFRKQNKVAVDDYRGYTEVLWNWRECFMFRGIPSSIVSTGSNIRTMSTTLETGTETTNELSSDRKVEQIDLTTVGEHIEDVQELNDAEEEDSFHKFRNNYAVKKIKLRQKRVAEFQNEIYILALVQGTTTVNVLGYYKKEAIVLIMEWYPGLLRDKLEDRGGISLDSRLKYTKQLLRCITELQAINPSKINQSSLRLWPRKSERTWIVHGDLHDRNIFIDSKDVLRLGDFGQSRIVRKYNQTIDDLIAIDALFNQLWLPHDRNIPVVINKLLQDCRYLREYYDGIISSKTNQQSGGFTSKMPKSLTTEPLLNPTGDEALELMPHIGVQHPAYSGSDKFNSTPRLRTMEHVYTRYQKNLSEHPEWARVLVPYEL